MVARIPVASEVTTNTIALLCSSGLPISELYGYSPASDSVAKTEYISSRHLVERHVVWPRWKDIIISIELPNSSRRCMSVAFPAGSLYYASDLEKVVVTSVQIQDFASGCRRSQLDVDLGPCRLLSIALLNWLISVDESAEAALINGAGKELI